MLRISGNDKWHSVGLAISAACFMLAMAPSLASAGDCSSTAAPGLDWSECNKRNIIIPESNLEGANLSGTDFTWTDLTGSNVTSANFEKSGLMKSSLAKAKASNANFNRIEAYRSNFSNISAEKASFNSSELQRSNFSGADLKGASFERAELGRVNFQKADLSGVQFSFANLARADLTDATIAGGVVFNQAFMFRTRIESLDLTTARGLEQAQINLACGNNSTKLPAGLSAPASWPCPADDPD